ncbi:hypothetical protein BDP81DRAFT_471455 [Colletotrichum phormii]|uniref:Uncharacterized protein n=1 Tax=Colletotrichum phormii TaxID=359342 RepID=A0AAI9ZSI2_9PEZI|nr:uncharacterized protein BDP81DRAFT_471455 [Colletotrichum phormii]KAK1637366.1 hypothetical protein BDP81DRAFT_471455 [Colletotrichum phormii]
MIAHPTILHIPPPPPPPVPVPLSMPMPMPMPFPPPQPIYPYPMAYQTNQYHSMQAQALGHSQGPSVAPRFPINTQYQQQPQPYPQAQQQTHYPWSQMPGLQQRSPQPPRRRPSLARRLFGLFNNPVGRASTIASSDSDSTRAPSIRSSRHTRTSSIATQPSPVARPKGDATHGADATRPVEVSPTVATVQSDDYIAPATMRDESPERRQPNSASSVPVNLGSKVQDEARGKVTAIESPAKEQDKAEPDNAKANPTWKPICEDAETARTYHPRPIVKPLKSALKNGRKAAAGARPSNMKNDQKLLSKEDPSAQTDFASSRMITSSMDAEASSRKGKEEEQQGSSVDKRSPNRDAVREVRRDYPDVLGMPKNAVETTKKPVSAPSSSPVRTTEKKQDQSSSPNQHLRGSSSRTEELRFDVSGSDVTETSGSLSDYSPPPSPPRPIHQGGGKKSVLGYDDRRGD